jgi:NADPH-dependent 2,4-dienoyl-CoA reductase/sulfur reductase-like enzyme/nitrite reductase/ring-hydroxylating ferredoxin subunit
MSGETQPTGPDLALGIDLSDIPDSGMLVGHVGEEGVLVVRRGEEVFAIGSSCTHYGGPLAEGLVVGDTVRCPWHHACFGLRNGKPQRPPALAPVASWRVEREGGRVVVREQNEQKAPAETGGGPASVVIVGGGAAGNMAAETLRREGYGGPITMISADPSVPYDRPNLSKDYLAGNAPEEWIPLHPHEFYEQHKIDLKLGTRVTAIDTAAKRLTLDGGETLAYDALLLATGADPIRLPIAGAELPHVHYLRSLGDSRALIERAKGAKRAVVMGASFIGLEVAASLRARGLPVDVVGPEEIPLARIMGDELGLSIRAFHEEHGVVFHLQQTAETIDADGVTLKDGTRLEADLVVIGAGVRPSVALAQSAGLTVDRGVLVDEYLATSAPGIWAAGDIASWPDPHSGQRMRVEHWVVAERQGQTAARNILGRGERFDAVPFFWSAHYDVTIAYVGHATRWDRIELQGSFADRNVVAAFHDGDRVAAVATIFRDDVSLGVEAAMERDDQAAIRSLVRGTSNIDLGGAVTP